MQIKKLEPSDIDNLIEFGKRNIEEFKYFHPHVFDKETLLHILGKIEKDLYYVIIFNNLIIGYGMLRGMDEGYEIPSLGIAIDKDYSGKGLGSLLMTFLETTAKLHKYTKMRLRVNEDNQKAISLYKKLGYNFTVSDEENLLGTKDLNSESIILWAV